MEELEKKYGLEPKVLTAAAREQEIDRMNQQYLD